MDRLRIPFCNDYEVYSSASVLFNKLNKPEWATHSEFSVSTTGTRLVGDYLLQLPEQCRQQNSISGQDYIADVRIHYLKIQQEQKISVVIDRQSGLVKALLSQY